MNYKHLSQIERHQIHSLMKAQHNITQIAQLLGRDKSTTRKVLQHAARHSFIQHIPEFPKVGIEDKPRGWFNVGEYKTITRAAKKLAGKRVEWRAHSEEIKGSYFCEPGGQLAPADRLIKRIEMTR
jgi:hypothetical protein